MLLPVAAFLAFGRYLPFLTDATAGDLTGREYRAGPAFMWTITLLDLGLALPATLAAWAGCRRGARWAVPALHGVLGWFALVGVAVAGMAVAMILRDDPGATVGATAFMVVLGGAFAALAGYVAASAPRR